MVRTAALQNLLFYICAVSFMCAFVVLMVHSAIEMRRQLHNLSTEDGANRSTAAAKTDVTRASTAPPFDWMQTNGERASGRDVTLNENIVPDRNHLLEDTPEERRKADRRQELPAAPRSDATTKTTRHTMVSINDVKRSESFSATRGLTTPPTSVNLHSSPATKSSVWTTNKGDSASASETTGHIRTMAEWFRKWSSSSGKYMATIWTNLEVTQYNGSTTEQHLKTT
ncbi:hypothetical protein HPB50_001052 [Hyalomma asiaticum]|uniref:Uncharacterized protein n=1 Tax=Hyalomma asiaticum TaxID=266040 RepID=A0ACB7RL92_HYAAI|nr:hypothetical protein HPB50_001052 [Hyalomma asiaticum]